MSSRIREDGITTQPTRVVQGLILMVCVLTIGRAAAAQGINYPVGNPTATSGAGNARTDPDNFFLRNNIAGMTEVPSRAEEENGCRLGVSPRNQWHFQSDIQLATYRLNRDFTVPALGQSFSSDARMGFPGFASEVLYVAGDHRYAFGVGTYTVYGFQSRLKDPATLGPFATYFDTKLASNDLAMGAAVRLHPKVSVGASFIIGRTYVVITQPVPALASLGIIRQSRLDVSDWGGPGASVGVNYRPTEKISFGFNYKTQRSYHLDGSLATAVVVPTPGGLQIIPVKPEVSVNLKPPMVYEIGFQLLPTEKLHFFGDFRYYDYPRSFQNIDVQDQQTGLVLASLRLDAFAVKSVRVGSIYDLSRATKLGFGFAWTSNGFPAFAISPGTINTGGVDISAGISKRFHQYWLNVSVAGIVGFNRTISPTENPVFPGDYGGHGVMLGLGFRY
jgi:long-subunit fatty acid transport protein